VSTVRLTRRGRMVVFVLCLLLAGIAAALAASASRAGPADTGEPEVAVVRPGDTLWSIAARHAPSDDPYGMIEDIRRLNDLTGNTIQPGQELILPP
jgi:LysM domain-containing protein